MSVSNGKTRVWPTDEPSDVDRSSYADATPTPFWIDRERPARRPAARADTKADLVVVGAGLTGLWAAVRARQEMPDLDVMLIEQEGIGYGASGRNGGFMSSSLVHGIGNGLARFPNEVRKLEELGLENLDAIKATIESESIDCDLTSPGVIETAMTPGQVEELDDAVDELEKFGHKAVLLDADNMRAELNSPLFKGGLWQKSGESLVDPVKLCDGLAKLAEELGVRIHEGTAMTGIDESKSSVKVSTPDANITAKRVLLATAAFHSPVGAIRRRIVPVFDYVLMTEPLSPAQWEAIGWDNRQGFSDAANQFHYYRPTADGRILWGGYDAVYNYGGRVEETYYQRDESFAGLAQRFFAAFPQLEGLRFSHRWGGVIDTCSRFFAFYGTSRGGRVGWAVGHTGLGVGASRFSAGVGLDLLHGRDSVVAGMEYLNSTPMPFPPEPLRWSAIQFTRSRLAAADRNDGKRGVWLKTLDRYGLGFDS